MTRIGRGLQENRGEVLKLKSGVETDAAFSFVSRFFSGGHWTMVTQLLFRGPPYLLPTCLPGSFSFVRSFCSSQFTQWPSGARSASNCAVPLPGRRLGTFASLNHGDMSVTHQCRGEPKELRRPVGGILVHGRVFGHHRRTRFLHSATSLPQHRLPMDTLRRPSLAKSEQSISQHQWPSFY